MPAHLTTESIMMCPHGGMVRAISTNTQVLADGAPLLRPSDVFAIAGCPFMLALVPHPCVTINWVQSATASTAVGDPTLTEASVGLCVAPDQAVQGTVLITMTQSAVQGN